MFSTPQQEELRQATIDLSFRYIKSRDDLRNQVGHEDGISEADLESLSMQINLLKSNKYLLAIVGESKSGKSAFINGLIKNSILPTGILQCTSAIIEILDTANNQYEGKTFLKVKYADGKDEQEYEIGNIQEKLQEVASIPEEYRSLPILQLNQFLIEESTKQITDKEIQDLLLQTDDRTSKPYLENPHNLSESTFKGLVKKYLSTYHDLSQIPTEIIVGYPLGFKFTQLRIVDTPGVNARGGLKTATIKSIMDASAVIFIHPIKNIASESLKDFLDNAIPKHVKDNIFMFLTYKAQVTEEDIKTTLEEAKKLFPQIKEGRIIAVDSILKRIYDELAAGKTSSELYQTNQEFKKLIAEYMIDFEGDEASIKAAIYEESNFLEAESKMH